MKRVISDDAVFPVARSKGECPSVPFSSPNAFKIQWELFLRHVALNEPFRWTLREGAKGVQLAELGMKSWKEKKWVDVPAV